MKCAKTAGRACVVALIVAAAATERPARAADPPVMGRLVLAQVGQTGPAKMFHGLGVVTAIEPDGSLTINHRAIEGLMPAMEMMFRVASPALSKGVRAGDEIEFDVEGTQYTIQKLRIIRHIG